MSDIPTADAPLDPTSAHLDSLDYEAYRDARKAEQAPDTTKPPVAEPPPPTETPGPTEPAPEPPPQEEPPQRDETGKFVKKSDKPRDNPVARIKELTAKQRAAEERAEAAERRAAELERQYRQSSPQEAQPPQEPQYTRPKPKMDDPQYAQADDIYQAWQEDLWDWKQEQRDLRQYQQQIEYQSYQRWISHLDRVQQFQQQHPDWEQVIQAPTTKVSAVMMTAIVESDKGPEIAYYLGTHPEVLAQLAKKSYDVHVSAAPVMQDYLESLVSSPPSAAANGTGSVQAIRHSRAAPPPTPVGNGSPAARDESPENEPYEAYYARRKREWAAQRR